MHRLGLYFIAYPLSFLLTAGITTLFIKAFVVPLETLDCFFIVLIEYIFIIIAMAFAVYISLLDVFDPYYYLPFYSFSCLIYMMMAWPLNIITLKKISQYRRLKAFFLAALCPLIFFPITCGYTHRYWWGYEVSERISQPVNADGFFERGMSKFRDGRNKVAIANLTRAIELSPNAWKYYYFRGQVYTREQQLDQAIIDLTKALEIFPGNIDCYLHRGEAYYKKGHLDSALADLNFYLEHKDKPLGDALYLRGEVHKQKGNLDQAIADFSAPPPFSGGEMTLPKIPENAQARIEAYILKKDFDQAWRDIQQVERSGYPVSPKVVERLRSDLTGAIELTPNHSQYYYYRGQVYLREQQLDQAISDLTKALEIFPGNIDCYLHRGEAYYKKERLDSALADLNFYLEHKDKPLGDALYLRGEVHKQKGDLDQAIADFTAVPLARGGVTKSNVKVQARIETYILKKDFDQAWRQVHKAIRSGYPVSPKVLERLRHDPGRDK